MEKIDHQIGVGCAQISDNEKKYVNEALNNNRLSYGPFLKKFENEIAKAHKARYAVSCNSGTDALRVAIATLKETEGWEDGDEVLVPAITFIATSNVVLQNNLKPVFVDVDPKIYNIDPGKIEEKITSKTKAIIPVHLFGLSAEMDQIMEIAEKYNLKVVEDACESMFATYKGQSVGTFGQMGCFSSYVAHILVTGVGGITITNNDDYAIILRSLVNHGRDSIYLNIDDDKTEDKEKLSMIVAKRFNFERLGYSARITELEGALGVGQMEVKDEVLRKRKENARYLIDNLKELENYIQLPSWPDYCEHSFMMFPIVVKDENIKKRDLINWLEENNIETRDMFHLLTQPVYLKIFGNLEDQYPVAKWIDNNGFYIGCHQALTKEDLDYVVYKVKEFLKNK